MKLARECNIYWQKLRSSKKYVLTISRTSCQNVSHIFIIRFWQTFFQKTIEWRNSSNFTRSALVPAYGNLVLQPFETLISKNYCYLTFNHLKILPTYLLLLIMVSALKCVNVVFLLNIFKIYKNSWFFQETFTNSLMNPFIHCHAEGDFNRIKKLNKHFVKYSYLFNIWRI